jgi:hypothetical protein
MAPKHQEPKDAITETAIPQNDLQRETEIRRGFRYSLLAIFFIIAGRLLIEALQRIPFISPFAGLISVLDLYGNTVIQEMGWPKNADSADSLVTIVDVSDMITTKDFRTAYKPREDLLKCVQTIAGVTPRPLAIGVDIDFSEFGNDSPNSELRDKEGHIIDSAKDLINFQDLNNPPDTRKFLKDILNLTKGSNGTPIVLGVQRQYCNSEDRWLWDENYKDLAGCLELASPDAPWPDRTEILYSVKSEKMKTELMAFGAKLGEHIDGCPKAPPQKIPLLEAIRAFTVDKGAPSTFQGETLKPRFSVFTLNTSYLAPLFDHYITYKEPGSLTPNLGRLRKHIVLVGNYAKSTDCIPLFGIHPDGVPGIVIQGGAALSRGAAFIYRPTFRGRIFLDFSVSLALLWVARLLCFRHGETLGLHSMHIVLSWVAFVVVFLIALLLAGALNILWTDFWLVGLALLIHYPVGHTLELVVRFLSFAKSRKLRA